MDSMGDMKNIVVEHGDGVAQGSAHCKKWRKGHKNCFGCPSELGCNKVIGLALAGLSGRSNVGEIYDKVLNAKTADELRAMRELEPVDAVFDIG